MPILAIETATGPCSVAVIGEKSILASLSEDRPMMQARRIVPMMEEAMQRAGLGYGDLSHVVASSGPGSFTGIRVGLAVARSLAMANGVHCAGISTFAVMAFAAAPEARSHGLPVACLLNAGRGEVYVQCFDTGEIPSPLADPAIAGAASLRRVLPAGGAWIAGYVPPSIAEVLHGDTRFPHSAVKSPDAVALAQLAAHMLSGGCLPQESPVPVYIRPPDAKPLNANS